METEFDLNALPLFLALARAGSFTGAAERLGCNKSKVSLSIKRLEQRLGVALVTRTTRQVHLTEAGERLLA
ncbi:MAG: LysR family transcriptional regulator, partial [Alcanivorax sp.]|nr:LysR family transcriptional regulator [Alcanivorax sp.]